MPTINYSVTQSINTLAVNLSASEALVMNINNPLVGASYFGLETIPNSDGIYTSASPKNTSGSFTMGAGVLGVVKDDYKMSAVVSPGNNVLTFIPALAVTGSTLRTRGISSPPISGFDVDALAFFTRVATAGGTLSTTEQTAVNQLVIDMKSANIWDAMKAIYPMVGSSAAACAQNLKSSSFTGTFTSGWTFASTGVTGNGTSTYMDTNYNPNSDSDTTINDFHHSVYINNGVVGNAIQGVFTQTPNIETDILPSYTGKFYAMINQASGELGVANTTRVGHFIGSRYQTNSIQYYISSTQVLSTASTPAASKNNLNYYIGLLNNNGTANFGNASRIALSTLGQGLTPTQASNFYTAVQAFQTTLSRQV